MACEFAFNRRKGVVGVPDLFARLVSGALGGDPVDSSLPWEQTEGGKWLAGGASLLMIGAVLWPVAQNWRERRRDGFPLSYYPMFTAKRAANVEVTHLVGIDSTGGRHQIPYTYAGSGGLNQVRRQINRAVRGGRAEALCDSVAARIALQESGGPAEVVRVQLVIGKYRLADYFAGETAPVSERVLAFSEVGRSTT